MSMLVIFLCGLVIIIVVLVRAYLWVDAAEKKTRSMVASERTPEDIREDIQRKQFLIEEAKLDDELEKLTRSASPEVVDRLKSFREEEQEKLRGLDDPELIREIRTYYRAKRMEVLRSGK
jgi:hypothetical protein